MATIKQIVDFMNENEVVWHPKAVVEVEESVAIVPGYEGHQTGIEKNDPSIFYIKQDCQRYIGHYYVKYEKGSSIKGVVLLPLSTGKYFKAKYNGFL